MSEAEPLSWRIDILELPDEGLEIAFTADEEARRRLAAHAAIPSVESLTAKGELRLFEGGVEVRLRLEASATQTCVVTLVPVPEKIRETIVRRYVAGLGDGGEPETGTVEIGLGDEDLPEPLAGDQIDLGPVLTEHFVLGLNPYPRAPGAELPAEAVSQTAKVSPFAALKSLKDKD